MTRGDDWQNSVYREIVNDCDMQLRLFLSDSV